MRLFMLKYIVLAVVLSCPAAYAEGQSNLKEGAEIYPTRPDGQRDWSANYFRVEKGEVVPIRPDGQRDWKANVYREEGGRIVPIRPDGQRDWNAPQYK